MSFTWDIKITAGTTASAPKEQILKITAGVITKIGIKYPRGCHGLVKAVLTKGGIFRLAPNNPDEWVTGDDETVEWKTYYVVDDQPTEIIFKGCSPGTLYDHTVTVRLDVLPKKVASMIPVLEVLTKVLQRLGVV